MDPSRAQPQPAGVKSRHPIGQAKKIGQIQLTDELLIFAERSDDLGGMLGAEPPPENGSGDDLGGQGRHFS